MKYWSMLIGTLWCVTAQGQTSPFNGRTVVPPDSAGNYRLLIGGHFHGASSNASGYPAATLLANIDRVNATNANALLSTGDLFLRPDRDSARYAGSLFRELTIPLFNAPGNHDLEGTAYPAGRVMPVEFSMGQDRVVLLDTERDDSRVKGDQLDLLNRLADRAAATPGTHTFIISHRPIWAEGDARYSDLFEGNTRALFDPGFQEDVLPILRRMAKHGEVYWISGSMAGTAPASIFFQPEEKGITYIQSAIRDELRDALLIADVSPNAVRWSAMSLSGQVLRPVETYDAQWWRKNQGRVQEFHWRRIPYLIKKNVIHPAFSYGLASGVVLMLLVLILRKRGRGK